MASELDRAAVSRNDFSPAKPIEEAEAPQGHGRRRRLGPFWKRFEQSDRTRFLVGITGPAGYSRFNRTVSLIRRVHGYGATRYHQWPIRAFPGYKVPRKSWRVRPLDPIALAGFR